MSIFERIQSGEKALAQSLSSEGIGDLNGFLERALVSFLNGENVSSHEKQLINFVISRSASLGDKIREFKSLRGEKPEKYVSSWVYRSDVSDILTQLALKMTE